MRYLRDGHDTPTARTLMLLPVAAAFVTASCVFMAPFPLGHPASFWSLGAAFAVKAVSFFIAVEALVVLSDRAMEAAKDYAARNQEAKANP